MVIVAAQKKTYIFARSIYIYISLSSEVELMMMQPQLLASSH